MYPYMAQDFYVEVVPHKLDTVNDILISSDELFCMVNQD